MFEPQSSTRRLFLRGLGGAVLGLPVLEGLLGREAHAAEAIPPFAIFFRQANGVAQATRTNEIGQEPERFWPSAVGAITPATLAGRSLEELVDHRDRLLAVRNVNMDYFDYGDGHASGALQGLTGRRPTVANSGGNAEAAGESIDHRIGRELNPQGRDSLFFYAGARGGWLGGPCVSYRGSGVRRSAIHDPWAGYLQVVGNNRGGVSPEAQLRLRARQQSVNDLVREQLTALRGSPRLSANDRRRLDLHLSSVREVELTLACGATTDEERRIQGLAPGFASTNGDEVLSAAQAHLSVAALAVACGYTRSAVVQVGSGNDGSTRYRNLTTGQLMENFHYISHRRASHDSSGSVIAGSDALHAMVDRQFARTFKTLLDRLASVPLPSGRTLLDAGVAAWYNDNAEGPPHGVRNVPWILAGSAGGALRQGLTVELPGGRQAHTHARLLNTLGAAVGLRKADGSPIDDFGDPGSPRAQLAELLV